MRRLSALIGILRAACFAVAVAGLLLAFAVPWPVSGPVLAVTLAVVGLIVIANLRGSRPRPQPYSTFESDALGHPVTERFLIPRPLGLAFGPDERVVCHAAPVMRTLSDWRRIFHAGATVVMGLGVVRNWENAIILTPRRLVALMLGPDDITRLVPHAPATRMLDALPGDAGAKRRFLCLAAARELAAALADLVSTKSLTDICSGRPAYSIPLDEMRDARL